MPRALARSRILLAGANDSARACTASRKNRIVTVHRLALVTLRGRCSMLLDSANAAWIAAASAHTLGNGDPHLRGLRRVDHRSAAIRGREPALIGRYVARSVLAQVARRRLGHKGAILGAVLWRPELEREDCDRESRIPKFHPPARRRRFVIPHRRAG
jgi:hypothetical protein